jgi:drug/metabolite transporter (DMT)-like permease
MKVLGVVCAVAGVGLIVYGDQLKTESYPYDLWAWAALLIVIGGVTFYRKWKP